MRFSLELPPRTRALAAGFAAAMLCAFFHELALRGYQRWPGGVLVAEASLMVPELAVHDGWVRIGDYLQTITGSRRAATGTIPVQVILLRTRPADPGGSERIAALLLALAKRRARLVVVDLPEAASSAADREAIRQAVLGSLEDGHRGEADAALGEWVAVPGRVLPDALGALPVLLSYRAVPGSSGMRVDPAPNLVLDRRSSKVAADVPPVPVLLGILPPEPVAARAAALGARCDVRDPDGVVRREPLLVSSGRGSRPFPTLALQAAQLALGIGPGDVHVEEGRLRLGSRSVPLSRGGLLLVDHRLRAKADWVPEHLLDEEVIAPRFDGAVVVLGATRDRDPVAFPLSDASEPTLSHAEHLASSILGLLEGRALRRLPGWDPPLRGMRPGVGPLLSLLAGLGCSLLTLVLPGRALFRGERAPLRALVVSALFPVSLWLAGSLVAVAWLGLWIDAVYPSLAMVAACAATSTADALFGGAERQALRRMVTRMLPREVAQEALRDAERVLVPGGAIREVSVLFADLRGFTELSEKHAPDVIVRVLRDYQTAMCRAVLSNGGAVDKLIGDGTMAFFGGFGKDPEHPRKAARAALAMLGALPAVNESWKGTLGRPLEMGIGIHSGPAVVGNMGTPEILSYTLIGDTVNVASRLEGLNKSLGTSILVSESTALALGGAFELEDLGSVEVKGKSGSVHVFALLRLR